MSTTISFDRPVGAATDVKELEYVSFLHQSGTEVRLDGSIRDEDIQAFLRSRYGIDVTIDSVRNVVMYGLGGSNNSEEVIDLVELTALLLIPVLLKAAPGAEESTDFRSQFRSAVVTTGSENNNHATDDGNAVNITDDKTTILRPPPDLIEFASKVILHDVTGDSSPKPLTIQLIKDILLSYGEHDLAKNDSILQEMLACATGSFTSSTTTTTTQKLSTTVSASNENLESVEEGEEEHGPTQVGENSITTTSNSIRQQSDQDEPANNKNEYVVGQELDAVFYANSFARALTYDVQLYDIQNEITVETSVEEYLPLQKSIITRSSRSRQRSSTSNNNNNNNDYYFDDEQPDVSVPENNNKSSIVHWERFFTAPAIDITASTFRSKFLIVVLWTTAVLFFGLWYLGGITESASSACEASGYQYGTSWSDNAATLQCNTIVSVFRWLLMFALIGAVGIFITAVGSVGNTVRCTSFVHPLIGCIPMIIIVLLIVGTIRNGDSNAVLIYFLYALASICILLHLTHVTEKILPRTFIQRHPWIEYCLKPGLHKAEQLAKRATAVKLNRMITNAIYLMKQADTNSVQDTYYGHGIHQFSKQGTWTTERVGGTIWTWESIWNERFFAVEGIWFSVRVLASNIGQFIVCVFVLWKGIQIMNQVLDGYDNNDNKAKIYAYTNHIIDQTISVSLVEKTVGKLVSIVAKFLQKIYDAGYIKLDCDFVANTLNQTVNYTEGNSLCLLINNNTQHEIDSLDQDTVDKILNSTGLDKYALTTTTVSAIQQGTQSAVESLYPAEKYMVSIPTGVAVGVAILTALYLSITYIPFAASTIMQLRCGMIPTLTDSEAKKYRVAQDSVTLLTGSLFWGTFVSAILTGLVDGLVVFLFLWQASLYFAQRMVALVIGIVVIFIIKFLLLTCFRRNFYPGFFRRRPARANISILGFEWANFILTSGIIILRMVILTVIALFSVGRIYKPFLARGVGYLGPIELDGYPSIHMRELLAHEAHRHPYMELLGLIYIMKLKHANDFGKTAGSCWRIIFVHAMMPWLQKYRVVQQQTTDDPASNNTKVIYENLNSVISQFTSLRSIRHQESSSPSNTNTTTTNNTSTLDRHAEHIDMQYVERLENQIVRLQKELDEVVQSKVVRGNNNETDLKKDVVSAENTA